MNIGSRMSLWGSNSSKIPYVTDGFCAWWDGEWNQGEIGFHDANAQDWVDLAGRAMVLGDKVGSITVGDNYYASVNGAKARLSNTIDKMLMDATEGTIEVVLDPSQITGFYPLFSIRPTRYAPAIELYRHNRDGVPNVYWAALNNESTILTNYNINGNESSVLRSTSITCDRNGLLKTYVNGEEQATLGTLSPNIFPSISSGVGTAIYAESYLAQSSITNFLGTCKIYCIRGYTRALAATEIAKNYAADCIRFPIN